METCEDSEGGGTKAELLDRNPAVAVMGMLIDHTVCSLNPGPATWEGKWITDLEILVAWGGQPRRWVLGWARGIWERNSPPQLWGDPWGRRQAQTFSPEILRGAEVIFTKPWAPLQWRKRPPGPDRCWGGLHTGVRIRIVGSRRATITQEEG